MARLLIADDNQLVRQSLKGTLSKHDGWTVCGEASNGQRAILQAAELKPDLIVMDFAMPMLNGIGAAVDIAKLFPTIPVVLYTVHKSPPLDRAAEEAGIRAVISKSDSFECLVRAIEELLAGQKTAESLDGAEADGSPREGAAVAGQSGA